MFIEVGSGERKKRRTMSQVSPAPHLLSTHSSQLSISNLSNKYLYSLQLFVSSTNAADFGYQYICIRNACGMHPSIHEFLSTVLLCFLLSFSFFIVHQSKLHVLLFNSFQPFFYSFVKPAAWDCDYEHDYILLQNCYVTVLLYFMQRHRG